MCLDKWIYQSTTLFLTRTINKSIKKAIYFITLDTSKLICLRIIMYRILMHLATKNYFVVNQIYILINWYPCFHLIETKTYEKYTWNYLIKPIMHNMICKWSMQMLWNRSSIKDAFCFADIKFNISNFDVNYQFQQSTHNTLYSTVSERKWMTWKLC